MCWDTGSFQDSTGLIGACVCSKFLSETHLRDSWPDYTIDTNYPLPITVVCNDICHVRNMQALQPWFNIISNFENPQRLIKGLRAISTNSRIPEIARVLTEGGRYYPMFHGANGREAIFTNWCVFLLLFLLCSTNILVFYRCDIKPYFLGWSQTRTKRCDTLLEALEWLLMRGTTYYSADEEAA